MKKETILEALKNAGVELEEEKFKELYKVLQTENGKDIDNAKKDYATKEKELADLKSKFENDLALKDAELKKFDANEIEELRKFKTDVLNKQKEDAQTNAIETLIGDEKYGFDKKAVKLLGIASKGKFLFDDANKITNADEVMSGLQNDYADYIVKTNVTGGKPADIVSTKTEPVDPFVAGFKSVK